MANTQILDLKYWIGAILEPSRPPGRPTREQEHSTAQHSTTILSRRRRLWRRRRRRRVNKARGGRCQRTRTRRDWPLYCLVSSRLVSSRTVIVHSLFCFALASVSQMLMHRLGSQVIKAIVNPTMRRRRTVRRTSRVASSARAA